MTDAIQTNENLERTYGSDAFSEVLDEFDTERLSSGRITEVDYERFAHFLDCCDASDEEKREFAQLVWNIVFSVASLGFELHPIQAVQKICGKSAFSQSTERSKRADVLD